MFYELVVYLIAPLLHKFWEPDIVYVLSVLYWFLFCEQWCISFDWANLLPNNFVALYLMLLRNKSICYIIQDSRMPKSVIVNDDIELLSVTTP